MNEFFVAKVHNLRSQFAAQSIDLQGCEKAMELKTCSLSLGFVSLKKIEQIIRNMKSSKAVAVDGLDS